MAHFRKIDVRIWNDEKFHSLSHHGKLAFLYMLTHPMMTSIGVIRATSVGLAHELGLPVEGFAEGFRKGLAEESSTSSCIWVKNFVKYQTPDNPNIIKSWVKVVDLIPEGDIKNLAISEARTVVEGLSKPFQEAFEKCFPKGIGNKGERRKEKGERRNTPLPIQAEEVTTEVGIDAATGEILGNPFGGEIISLARRHV